MGHVLTHWPASQLEPWLAALQGGLVTAAPAEGAYGYCADPFHVAALASIIALKARDPAKGLICLIGDKSQLNLLCPPLNAAQQGAVDSCWQPWQPPITLILPALPTLPPLLTGGRGTVAVRLPQPAYVQAYLRAWATASASQGGGPLVSTSLNLSGQPPARRVADLPPGTVALRHPVALPGTVSRIYDPTQNTWLR
jgi:L-threonylcarbamoyladenylate synthase